MIKKRSPKHLWWGGGIILGLLVAISLILLTQFKDKKVTLTHIHGLGFTSDGSQLLIPAHDGIMAFTNGRWGPSKGISMITWGSTW